MGIAANLVEGSGGILEVQIDNKLVYTNKGNKAEEYPGDEEIVKRLEHIVPVVQSLEQPRSKDMVDGSNTPSNPIEPPPVVKPPDKEKRTAIDEMSFACNCAPVTGPEGCSCRN